MVATAAVERPQGLNAKEISVYDAIRAAGANGATIADLAERLGVPDNQVSPRVTELHAAGHIKKSGFLKRTKSGRYASCWITSNAAAHPGLL